jgi:hypothetical protein
MIHDNEISWEDQLSAVGDENGYNEADYESVGEEDSR